MNTAIVLVIAIIIIAAIVLALWIYSRRRRSAELRERFGPEYERAVDEYGATGRAEKVLTERAERVERLHIRALSADESARYAAEWRTVQARFVDDPEVAIAEADRLVGEVMQARGYPVGNFEQRAADVSVDHPQVVEHYRAAHHLAGQSAKGQATTEDMRQAMVHYRQLFDELIGAREPASQEVRR
jgi:FtsZ-interacting cell division protein ZipA